jgi:hypothetical protein
MRFSFEEMIEFCTLDSVVEPGDLLGSWDDRRRMRPRVRPLPRRGLPRR